MASCLFTTSSMFELVLLSAHEPSDPAVADLFDQQVAALCSSLLFQLCRYVDP